MVGASVFLQGLGCAADFAPLNPTLNSAAPRDSSKELSQDRARKDSMKYHLQHSQG